MTISSSKLVLNISDTPTWAKALPLALGLAGIGLAIYQKKNCVGCFLGYGLSGVAIGMIPFVYQAKQAAEIKILEDCGCGGK